MRANLLRGVALSCLLAMAGCAQPQTVTSVGAGQQRPDVNPNYTLGRLELDQPKLPSLQEMENVQAQAGNPLADVKDRLHVQAVRDEALKYGAQGGLAWASQQINRLLEAKAAELTRIYDFNAFLIHEPQGVTLLPPVISEAKDTYEQQDAGRTLRVADRYYRIDAQARFAPVAPLWHSYLIRTYSAPDQPDNDLLPKNAAERNVWIAYVRKGWDEGVQQARDIFKMDLERLNRDFTGMVRYAHLLEEGKVSPPVVAGQDMGVTGNGSEMRVNDRAFRITRNPRLNVDRPDDWKSAPSNLPPVDAATPPGAKPADTGE